MKEKLVKFNRYVNRPAFYYLLPFVSLSGVLTFLILKGASFRAYSYYILQFVYNYKHGFIPRALIGEIISWFCDIVTPEVTATVSAIGSFLLIFISSAAIGYSLSKSRNTAQFKIVAVMCLLICLLPFTFRYYMRGIIFDKFVWALALTAVLASENKFTVWLVPAICLVALAVNPVFMFTSMVFVALILLQKVIDSGYSKKMIFISALTYISLIAGMFYIMYAERHTGFANADEFFDFYMARYSGPDKEYLLGEGRDYIIETALFEFFYSTKDSLYAAFKNYLIGWKSYQGIIASTLFLYIPLYIPLVCFWISCIKNAKNKIQKAVFFLCMVSWIPALFAIAVSWVSAKYFSNNILVQMLLVVYFLVQQNKEALESVEQVKAFVQTNRFFTALYGTYLVFILTYS